MSRETADLPDLHLVQSLCKFLGITALNKSEPSSYYYKIYAGLLITLNVCGFVHSVSGEYSIVLTRMDLAFIATDILMNSLMTAFITMTILTGTFVYSEKIAKTKSLIQSCSVLTGNKCGKVYSCKRRFIIFNIAIIVLLICDTANWITSSGIQIFQQFIWREIQVYYASLVVFVMTYIADTIKYRVQSINKCLRNSNADRRLKEGITVYFLNEPRRENIRTTKEISRKFGTVHEIFQTYNDLFGLLILLLLCTSVAIILNVVDVIIVYHRTGAFGNANGVNLTIICLCWITIALVMPTLIAASCNGAAKEAEKTATICFALLNELPTIPKTENDKIIREELILLSHQATARCPKFSAAGFFNVDYSILGFILGTVTTYVIVILQFHGQ